jgi:uncharacterized protein (UPF0297 family)
MSQKEYKQAIKAIIGEGSKNLKNRAYNPKLNQQEWEIPRIKELVRESSKTLKNKFYNPKKDF